MIAASGALARRAACVALAVIALLWVPAYNGYPLVWWDSGAYLHSSFLFTVPDSRPVFYGLFLAAAGSHFTLWGAIVLQAALVVYLLGRVLVACDAPLGRASRTDLRIVAVGLILAVLTGLSWAAGEAMPDVFAGIAVLSLFVLLEDSATGMPRLIAGTVFVLSLAVHFTHIPLAIGLLTVAAAASRLGWSISPRGLARGAAGVVIAVLVIPTVNRVASGRWFITDATPNMLLDRFLAEGIAQKVLADRCPAAGYSLCPYRFTLPEVPGWYLWNPQSPFARIGGWTGSRAEASRLVRDSIRAYPWLVLRRTTEAFASQLGRFSTYTDAERFGPGTGIDYEMRTRLPWEYERYAHSLQQQGRLQPAAWRRLHWWIGAACGVAALFMCIARRRSRPRDAVLQLMCVAAVIVNAGVIAAGGSPDDRYGARVIWLTTVAVLVTLLNLPRSTYFPASMGTSSCQNSTAS